MIDSISNAATRGAPPQKRRELEKIDVHRPRSRKGGFEYVSYDFGEKYSKPAVVRDGKVYFLDGTPRS